MSPGNNTVIVTGGAGYIGSHIVVKLYEAGRTPVIVDHFYNSSPTVIGKLEMLFGNSLAFALLDMRDETSLVSLLSRKQPQAVIHGACLKAVGRSVDRPSMYYDQTIGVTLNLLKQMDKVGCRQIVFSSSAKVCGEAAKVPSRKTTRTCPANPYGRTKLFIEEIIGDWAAIGDGRSAALLRYFNPIGADVSGFIGDNSKGIPNILMPLMLDVAIGQRDELSVFGDDFNTPDGTAIRDYIHVDDLAREHIAALDFTARATVAEVFNLGTGTGVSVLELITAFERVTGPTVALRITQRRPGDVPIYFADPQRARKILGWETRLNLERMCADSWRFCSLKQTEKED